ncbi:PARP15 [Bugula neritina]|uniref:Poly [ADP-ribose] polymerase n=1 Tax=Bugula neritina TaxID=10212 RepID=A0A7J7KL29_BUGNE|nr:PARP15 [Bugula neritina]
MTNGYRLNCADVLHVNCPAWDTKSSDKVLEKLISKCLLWTKDNSARSIAFPAIGTGLLRFPPDVVAKSFVRAAAKFAKDNEDTTVERIIMIVYDKDSVTQQGFEKALDLKIKAMPTIKSSDSKQPIDGEGKFVRSVPETWEKPLNIYREFAVSKHTLEWKNVSSSFLKTIGKPVGAVTVLAVRRVQNPKSYFLYDSNRAFVAQKLSRREDQVETTPLWHATAEDNIQKITHGKFDRGLSGKVGDNLLGAGCYFSTTSGYSDNWNSPVNAAGEKHMIMVRVVTGDFCKGDNSLKTAPYKPGSKTEQYDSVVDDVSNPTKYVVYHDASAYPEYIVKYKL